MKYNDLLDMMDEDSEIDGKNLDLEALRISKLYTKYLRVYRDELRDARSLEMEHDMLHRRRMDYYLGLRPDEEYDEKKGGKPLLFKALKSELDTYLKGDEELQRLRHRLMDQKTKCEAIETFMKSLKDRGFNVRTAIDVRKFNAGA